MTQKDLPRFAVTCMVFVLFAFILWHNVDNEMLIGAMIGALSTAVAFWLGSSKGSSDKSAQIEQMTVEPQEVLVTNDPRHAVPVEERQ